MKGFGSDNHSGVHPRLMEAIVKANRDHAPSYGTDLWSQEAERVFRELFGDSTKVFFVFNGTAANVLALASLVKPFEAVLATEDSHLHNDECGAPERHLGSKLITIPTRDAKLSPALLKPYLIRRGDQHRSQIRAISITQPTELGTLYTIDEIKELARFAKAEGLFLHMDGARLVNAAAALGVELRALTADCGVDVVSFGGTKNGLMFGEAVLFLNPALAENFKYIRKQMMQLPSKTRFISAQFVEFLGTELWRENSQHANLMARELFRGLQEIPGVEISRPQQVNSVFAKFPKAWVSKLKDIAFFYVWDELTFECRLMTTWDTRPEEITHFVNEVKSLSASRPSH